MQANISGAATLPSLESGEESVTLQSHNGQGLGFEVSARPDGSFAVDHVQSDSIAGATGKIKAGDQLTAIGIDLGRLKPDEASKLLNAIAAFPVKLSVKRQGQGSVAGGLGAGLKVDAPKLNLSVNGAKQDATLPEGKLDIGFSGTAPSIGGVVSADLPTVSTEVEGTSKGSINIDMPQVEIDPGRIDLSGGKSSSVGNKLKGLFSSGNGKNDKHGKGTGKADVSVSFPTVELDADKLGGGNVNASVKTGDVDLSIDQPNVNVDISRSTIEGDLKVKAPKAERESWFDKHKPKISLGKSGKYSVTDASANLDADIPGLEGNITAAKSDIKGKAELKGKTPKVDIDVPHASGEASFNIQQPKTGVGSIGSDVDANVTANLGITKPKLETNIPEPTGNISVTAPSIDLSVPTVDTESSGTSIGGKIKGFFKRGDSKKKKGKTDNSGQIQIGLNTDIQKPSMEINTEANLPQITSEGKLEMPQTNVSMQGPSISTNLPQFGTALEGHVQIQAPDSQLGIDTLHDAKSKSPAGIQVKFPSQGLKDISAKGQLDVGADASLPSGGIEGKVEGHLPDVDVKVDKPKGGFHVEMPKFGFKGEGAKGELDVDAESSLPHGGIEGNIEGPDVDIDLQKKKGGGGFKFGLPSFGIKGKSDLGDRKPKGDIDFGAEVSLPSGKVEGTVISDIEVNAGQSKETGALGFGMPGFSAERKVAGSSADIEFSSPRAEFDIPSVSTHFDSNLGGPGVKGGVRAEVPVPSLSGDLRTSSPGAEAAVNLEGPDVDISSPKGKGSKKIDIGGKMKRLFSSDKKKSKNGLKGEVALSPGVVNMSGPQIDFGGNIDIPSVDAGVEARKESSGVNVNFPTADVHTKSKEVKGHLGANVRAPKGGVDASVNQKESGNAGLNIALSKSDALEGKTKVEFPEARVDAGSFPLGLPKFGINWEGSKEAESLGGTKMETDGRLSAEVRDAKIDAGKIAASVEIPSYNVEGSLPKLGGAVAGGGHVKGGVPEKDAVTGVQVDLPTVSLDTNIKKPDSGLDFSATAPLAVATAGTPGADIQLGRGKSSGDASLRGGASLDVRVDQPKASLSGGFDMESPTVQTDRVEFKSDKRSSLGRKVKGFFSSKDRSSSPKADVDVSLGVAGDKPAVGAAGGAKSGVHADLKTGKDGECGFATSYDVGLHREAGVDIPSSPSISVGGEAATEGSSPPASDNERSMLHDDKGQKFHVKIGSGKSSKSKAEKKKRPRIQEGLRSGLATELVVSAGHVQLPEQDEKSRQSEDSVKTHKKKTASQSEAA